MTPIIKRLELAEAALTKNGFVLVDDVWVAQPDSGRDAALLALSKLQRCMEIGTGCMGTPDDRVIVSFSAGWSGDNYTEFTFGDLRNLSELAAHPAPSSDAALSDQQIGEIWHEAQVHGKSSYLSYARAILAAHPANGAQADKKGTLP